MVPELRDFLAKDDKGKSYLKNTASDYAQQLRFWLVFCVHELKDTMEGGLGKVTVNRVLQYLNNYVMHKRLEQGPRKGELVGAGEVNKVLSALRWLKVREGEGGREGSFCREGEGWREPSRKR
jgi:hypothetical protein